MTPNIESLDPDDLLAAATMLSKLLGLSEAQADALLSGDISNQPSFHQPKEKPVNIKDKEYILTRRETCTTCQTTSEKSFHMKQLLQRNLLVATALVPGTTGLTTVTEHHTVRTCCHCHENLSLLSKSEIITLYLELLSKEKEKAKSYGFYELEESFTSTQIPRRKTSHSRETETEA